MADARSSSGVFPFGTPPLAAALAGLALRRRCPPAARPRRGLATPRPLPVHSRRRSWPCRPLRAGRVRPPARLAVEYHTCVVFGKAKRKGGREAAPLQSETQLVPGPKQLPGPRDYDCDVSEWTADRAPADGLLPLPLEGPGGVADAGAAVPGRLIGNCRALRQDRHGHVMWVSRGAAFRSNDSIGRIPP